MDKRHEKAIEIWQKAAHLSKEINEALTGYHIEEIAIGMGLSAAFVATKFLKEEDASKFFMLITDSMAKHYKMNYGKGN